jgi:hypothetical protein
MIVVESGDKVQGDATAANEVDFTLHGLDNKILKQLADGQLPSTIGDLYTADSVDVVSSIILVNTAAAHNHVNLYLTPSGGTARRLIPKDLQLEAGYSLHFDGAKVMVLDAAGGIVSGASVSDMAYAASWDGVTNIAPSKNTIYDKIEEILALPSGMKWSIITGATNAVTQNGYVCDTSGAAFTLTLPASPAAGDIVGVTDGAGTFDTKNLTIARNSKNIMGLADDLTVSTKYAAFSLIYADATNGWRIA